MVGKMKALKICLFVVVLVLAGRSFAAPGTAAVDGAPGFEVASSSCADVRAGWGDAYNYEAMSCSADPVVLGSTLLLQPRYDRSNPGTEYVVNMMTATPNEPAPPTPPAPEASATASSSADAAALLSAVLAGFTVLAFAAGYLGGVNQ